MIDCLLSMIKTLALRSLLFGGNIFFFKFFLKALVRNLAPYQSTFSPSHILFEVAENTAKGRL